MDTLRNLCDRIFHGDKDEKIREDIITYARDHGREEMIEVEGVLHRGITLQVIIQSNPWYSVNVLIDDHLKRATVDISTIGTRPLMYHYEKQLS